jgi:peptidyl-prolyl cis-trans isomerase B (cyclophilin B)
LFCGANSLGISCNNNSGLQGKEMITLKTNYGDISVTLDSNTPVTSNNFISYAKSGFYDGTIFHRVINGFMIQGGGFDTNMKQKPTGQAIHNEANKGGANKIGTIAMARTSDPHSATAQFFINVADNDFLNFSTESSNGWGYCVFGKVTAGMDVVGKIKEVVTTNRLGHQNVPVDPVMIEKVIVAEIDELTENK